MAFWAPVWAGIKAGAATIGKFVSAHKVGIGLGVSATTSMLSGSSFETKNKRVTFGRAGTFGSGDGKAFYTLPTVRVADKKVHLPYGSDYGYPQADYSGSNNSSSRSGEWSRPPYPRR